MENSTENVIDISEILLLLARNISKILIVGIITAVIAFTYTKTSMIPLYESNAKMVIKVSAEGTMANYGDVQTAVGLVNDCMEVIQSRQIMQNVIDKLELDYSAEQLLGAVGISAPENTRVLRLSVLNPDPQLARDIAEAICTETESTVAEKVGVDSINTFEMPTTPVRPSSPNVTKNTLTGAFVGMFAVAMYLIVARMINNKIHTPEDVEQVLGLSVLSSIPYIGTEEEKSTETAEKKTASASKGGKK